MPNYYPVMLDLRGRSVLVVGRDRIAAEKASALHACGAEVTVVATRPGRSMRALVESGTVTLRQRDFAPDDLDGAFLVVAATDDQALIDMLWDETQRRGQIINIVDVPARCNFIVPSILRRGQLTIAVSTEGASPSLAKRIRQRLEEVIGPAYGPFLRLSATARACLRESGVSYDERDRFFGELYNGAVLAHLADDEPALAANETAALLEKYGVSVEPAALHEDGYAEPPFAGERRRGIVYLVGAGPGDPELITVKALRCLRRAEVVVYDRLIGPELLDEAPAGALRIYVGKGPGCHSMPQHEINALLVAHGRRGAVVVRLKGGDPFVFGRGGEEALALHEAGIPFEVVPGISSAVAVPAYAGIPVTHRGHAPLVTIVTGHQGVGGGGQAVDWTALAALGGTLVILMGVAALPEIASSLIAAGLDAATPAAVVEQGTTAQQRTVTGSVETIAARAQAAGIRSPAVTVIGVVAALHDRLSWFGSIADTAVNEHRR